MFTQRDGSGSKISDEMTLLPVAITSFSYKIHLKDSSDRAVGGRLSSCVMVYGA